MSKPNFAHPDSYGGSVNGGIRLISPSVNIRNILHRFDEVTIRWLIRITDPNSNLDLTYAMYNTFNVLVPSWPFQMLLMKPIICLGVTVITSHLENLNGSVFVTFHCETLSISLWRPLMVSDHGYHTAIANLMWSASANNSNQGIMNTVYNIIYRYKEHWRSKKTTSWYSRCRFVYILDSKIPIFTKNLIFVTTNRFGLKPCCVFVLWV